MAKYINQKKLQQELFQRTEGYAANVRKIYMDAFTKIINLVKGTELEDGKPFSFSEYGYSEETTPILRKMYSQVYQVIRGGIEKEWLNSNENNDSLVKSVFGEHSIEDNHFAKYFKRNQEAMNAFFARKTGEKGLDLSQRVWKYTGMYKDELEDSLDLALGEGTPANRLATKIQQYLQEPDKFYRRFRVKIGEDDDGNPVYGRVWKRRIWSKEDDSYKWIDDDPRKYHPGKGVYRSSYRNAQRLARTETNIAYRSADYERWQDLDFITGIEIKLSNNHPQQDICDDLKGVYPKDFKWTGWHPNCRCYEVPVIAPEENLYEMLDNIMDGKDPGSVSCDRVEDLPEQYKSWSEQNQERIEKATVNGTLPYFIRDNEGKKFGQPKKLTPQEIAKIRHEQRTPVEEYQIKKAWREERATYHYADRMLRVMGGISDVDTTAMAEAYRTGNIKAILAEGNKLKAVGKHIYSLDLLDDPMSVAKKFSLADAEAVQNAVKTKLNIVLKDDLSSQLSTLQFEIDWVTNHKKYKTWEVAVNAYQKAYRGVQYNIELEKVNNSIGKIQQFLKEAPKSKKVKELYAQIQEAINKKDIDKAKILCGDANSSISQYLQKKIQKELGKSPKKLEKYISEHYTTDFTVTSQERYESIMKMLGDSTKEVWNNSTLEQKQAFPYYTNDSSHSKRILTNVGLGKPEPKAKLMDAILDKIRTTEDMVLRSGQDYEVAGFVFGEDFQTLLKSGNIDELNSKYAGSVGVNKAYMSTSFNKNGGFSKQFEVHIYAPKGTQCINLNEISCFGHNKGTGWDGYSFHPTWSDTGETEIFLHRGYKWKFIRAEAGTGKCGENRIYIQLLERFKEKK